MSRLGGTNGMAQAIAIASFAPGGTVVVGSALVMDEVEHYRAGIGCVLESNSDGEVCISVVVTGGAAHQSGIQEGDVILKVNEYWVQRGIGVETVSEHIRGPIGSQVLLKIRKLHGATVDYHIHRARVPGAGTEMLGALFQRSSIKPSVPTREASFQEKLGKLFDLHQRGNLSDEELAAAKKRLMSGQDSQLAAQSSGPSLGTFFSTIGADFMGLIEDPEVHRRKQASLQQRRP